MVVEYMTKKGSYGTRDYLVIDHDKKVYCRPYRLPRLTEIEIKRKDMRSLIDSLIENNYSEVDRV